MKDLENQRAAFEAWYVEHFKEHTGRKDFTLEVMQSMRGLHNDYRETAYLHGLWIGYQASLESPDVQALRKDAERLMFACEFDGFTTVKKDRYEYTIECAQESGRDIPTKEDELNGLRRLIDAAMEKLK